jgi:GTP-binding protein EngB required for normal cell division
MGGLFSGGGGGRDVHHYHYATNERLNQQLEDLKKVAAQNSEDNKRLRDKLAQAEQDKAEFDKQMAGLKVELDKASDPVNFLEAKQRVFEKFLGKLDKNMFDTRVYQDGKENIGMFGIICAGKSMLINALFNDPNKCETGRGETTKEIKTIGECYHVKLWDLPGNSIHFSFLEFDHLCFLASLSKVCVCVESSLHDPFYNDLLRICKKLQLKVIIVVTKMDDANTEERITLPAKIRKEATEVGYGDAPIFSVSARERLDGKVTYDWGRFIEELSSRL